jgi:hypothetical protein
MTIIDRELLAIWSGSSSPSSLAKGDIVILDNLGSRNEESAQTPSAPEMSISSSCRLKDPISIQWGRCLSNSDISRPTLGVATSRSPGERSVSSSPPSHRPNVKIS